MLDYRMKTFLTLYDEMNYRKTAEVLNMTQPGVTQHIHYIENHYNIKLFEYKGRTLMKTHDAELLKRCLESVMAQEKTMKSSFVKNDKIHLDIGATKTIGEFVIVPEIREFLRKPKHNINLVIDNTENLLDRLTKSELDFAIIEGVFDKTRYGYRLYKKENFLGICSKTHPFSGKKVSLSEIFKETLIIREKGSGSRRLLEQAVENLGYSLESFARCISVSNFSVITNLVANDDAITFAYKPIAVQNENLSTFEVEGMEIIGEFNFVYCNEEAVKDKIALLFHE